MKKVVAMMLCGVMIAGMTGCADSTNNTDDTETVSKGGGEVVEDPDTYEGAVEYVTLIEDYGAIPAPEDGTTIGFAAKAFENEYWAALKDGVEDQGEELKEAGYDVTVDVRAAQGESDEQGQAALMSDMVNKEYDIILASPISDGNLIQATEKAHEAGIPVIDSIGGFVPDMDIFVGPQHYHSGELAAEWISDKLGDESGQVTVIMGLTQESAARARTQGFEEWFAENRSDIEVIEPQNADWDRTQAKEVMETLIKQYPDLKAVYANNDTMAMGALEAVISAGKEDEILVIGNDGTNEALQSIEEGKLDATVNIFPYYGGKITVDVALRTLGGQELPKVIYTNQTVVDSENVGMDMDELAGWTGLEFE